MASGSKKPIKKCDGAGCPLKDKCKRYSTEKGSMNEFMASTPYNALIKRCFFYLKKEDNDSK